MNRVVPIKASETLMDIQPVAARVGAEIKGVRLSGDLSAEVVSAIYSSLLRYKVVFFRGQSHLDDREHERFAKLLGKPLVHASLPAHMADNGPVMEVDGAKSGGRSDNWHTDTTYVDAYPKATILRGVVIPPFGGDTMWANTVAGYETLRPELRELADKLWTVHSNEFYYETLRPEATEEDKIRFDQVATGQVFETQHPMVRVHPETDERALLLGHFVKYVVGYRLDESARLLEVFKNHVIQPENCVRWRWAVGDVAIWDNRATQHYALNDYGNQPRVVNRVTLEGDVPVSVDGQRSIVRKHVVKDAPSAQ